MTFSRTNKALLFPLLEKPASGNEEKRIVDDILRGYGSRVIRPVRNSSNSMDVTLRLLISQIVDFVSHQNNAGGPQ